MKLLTTIGAFLFSGLVTATPLHNIVVFGDSLSDNGNLYEFMKHQLPQSPPYYQGRFSNGPVWIEHLAASYFPSNPSSHLQDYAFGGAGVSETDDDVLLTLKKEVESYLVANHDKASSDSLFIIWIGANNYLGMPSEIEQTLHEVNQGIRHSVQRLVEKGAKHILLINLPDLGKTPAAIEFNSIETMSYFAHQHNEALATTVSEFKQEYPDVEWIFFDMEKIYNQVLDNAADFGFTNITESCVNSSSDEKTPRSVLRMVAQVSPKDQGKICDGYMFFDLVHPTEYAHKIMAEKAHMMLDDLGIVLTE